MKVRLTQIGNSMSFQIPQAAMEHCINHDECEMEINSDSITLRPVKKMKSHLISNDSSTVNDIVIKELFESVNFSM